MGTDAIRPKNSGVPLASERPELAAWLRAPGLVLLALAAYGPVWQAGFIWDDDAHVTNNKTLRSLAGLGKIWFDPEATPQYYPLVHTSFWLEYHAWGLHPLGYHLINVLLHASNALLLWLVLRRLGVPGAFWAAALFAVHPVEVESVAWITERKNVLSTLCYLAGFLAWLRFWPADEVAPRPAGRWRFYALTLLLFVAALLSKTVTCSLPAALLLARWWKHGRITRRDLLATAPLFALGMALGLHTVFLEKYHVGASGADWHWSALERVLIAGRAVWFYVGKLVWPAPLTFIYPQWQIRAGSGWQYGLPFAAVAVVLTLYSLRQRLGRGPLAAVLFFGGTLVPALGFFNVYPMRFSFVADHFQYLASVGMLALAGAGVAWLVGHAHAPLRWLAWGTVGLSIALLGMRTWQQVQVYQDELTVWTDTLARNPACWMAYSNRGAVYATLGQRPQAIADYTRAIELKPDMASPYTSRGTVFAEAGQLQQAIADSTRAIELQPDLATAYNNRGMAYQQVGQTAQAIADYTRAIELQPDMAGAYANRGLACLQAGQVQQAIADTTQAIALEPDLAGAYSDRGLAYQQAGQLNQAICDFTCALELAPGAVSYYNRGNAYVRLGQLPQALHDYTRSIELKPDYVEAYGSRGILHHHLGQVQEAISDYSRAVDLKPDFVGAIADRAQAYEELGQTRQAISDYSRAIALKPDLAAAYCQRGTLYQKEGQNELALQDFNHALLLRPDWSDVYFARAFLHYQARRFEDAWSDIKHGKELGGTPNPELLRGLLQVSVLQ